MVLLLKFTLVRVVNRLLIMILWVFSVGVLSLIIFVRFIISVVSVSWRLAVSVFFPHIPLVVHPVSFAVCSH